MRFRRFAIAIACPEKKKKYKDSTEIRKTIKDSNVLESFNNNNNKKDSTETRKIIKDSEEFGIFYLECYCCKQQLKDSNLTFTLTLNVNKC